MTLRTATRTMTGATSKSATVVLGFDAFRRPSVTVHPFGRGYSCYSDPAVLRALVDDLTAAIAHLEGAS